MEVIMNKFMTKYYTFFLIIALSAIGEVSASPEERLVQEINNLTEGLHRTQTFSEIAEKISATMKVLVEYEDELISEDKDLRGVVAAVKKLATKLRFVLPLIRVASHVEAEAMEESKIIPLLRQLTHDIGANFSFKGIFLGVLQPVWDILHHAEDIEHVMNLTKQEKHFKGQLINMFLESSSEQDEDKETLSSKKVSPELTQKPTLCIKNKRFEEDESSWKKFDAIEKRRELKQQEIAQEQQERRDEERSRELEKQEKERRIELKKAESADRAAEVAVFEYDKYLGRLGKKGRNEIMQRRELRDQAYDQINEEKEEK